MKLHLLVVGWLLVILAGVHIFFPSYFKWKQNLAVLTLLDRQVMYIHTLFIAIAVFLMGLICIIDSDELLNTKLGRNILTGLFIFWMMRLLVQFLGYSSQLWRGKKFETRIHWLFVILFGYVVFVLGAAIINSPTASA